MRAVRDGDVGQLGVLFERYHGPVFDFLSRMTGDRVAAEDMVQDVFMRILKYRGTYRDGGSFETWLYRIARNARADYFRQRPPVDALGDAALDRPEPQPGPARTFEAARERDRLRRALMELREDKRELLVLARYRDLKYEQIADILGIEVGAVKVRVHRALRELREIFLQLQDGNPTWIAKPSRRTFQII